jgi:hypothetical protein
MAFRARRVVLSSLSVVVVVALVAVAVPAGGRY